MTIQPYNTIKMKHTISIIFFSVGLLCSLSPIYGQAARMDSLANIVNKLPDTSPKVKILLQLSKYHYCGETALKYANQAYSIAKRLKNELLLANVYTRLSWQQYCEYQLDSANWWLRKAYPIYKRTENNYGLHRYYLLSATYLEDYPEIKLLNALFEKSYFYAQKTKNNYYVANTLNNWSIALFKNNEPCAPKDKMLKAISLIDTTFDVAEKGRLHYNLARAYKGCGEYPKAITHYLASYRFRKKGVNPAAMGEVYIRLAEILIEDIQDKDSVSRQLIYNTLQISDVNTLLDTAYVLATMTNSEGLQRSVFQIKIKYYKNEKDYETAFLYLEKLKAFDEAVLLNKENLKGLVSIKSQYEKQVLENEVLKSQLQNKKTATQRNYLVITVIILIYSLILGWITFFQKERIRKAKITFKEQELKELRNQQQILAMNAMLEGQERERARIARDLHDGLGNLLISVKHNILKIPRIDDLKSDAELLIDEACSEVRRIAHNMMPQALQQLGLHKVLEDLSNQMNKTQSFEVVFQTFGKPKKLSENKKIMIYRVVQEAFNNIRKHARATEVILQMTYGDDWLNLTIEDNGVGFNKNASEFNNGLGLHSILSRIAYIEGECSIESQIGEGTALNITVNVNDNE